MKLTPELKAIWNYLSIRFDDLQMQKENTDPVAVSVLESIDVRMLEILEIRQFILESLEL